MFKLSSPTLYSKRPPRLKGFNYSSAGAYFITFCTRFSQHFFGKVEGGSMQLNQAGLMVWQIWQGLPNRFTNLELGDFEVMPNHVHAILVLKDVAAPLVGASARAGTRPAATSPGATRAMGAATSLGAATVGQIIGALKSITTLEYIRGVKGKGWSPFDRELWQSNYWEHVIRNGEEWQRISNYIAATPRQWDKDQFNAKGNRGDPTGELVEIDLEANQEG